MAITITVVLISLFISFIIVTALSDYAYAKKLQFGQPVCGTMYQNFGFTEDELYTYTDSATFEDNTSNLQDQALKEYNGFEDTQDTTYFKSGYTNCYCTAASDVGYDYSGLDMCNYYFE
jgi:hypothetical protein